MHERVRGEDGGDLVRYRMVTGDHGDGGDRADFGEQFAQPALGHFGDGVDGPADEGGRVVPPGGGVERLGRYPALGQVQRPPAQQRRVLDRDGDGAAGPAADPDGAGHG